MICLALKALVIGRVDKHVLFLRYYDGIVFYALGGQNLRCDTAVQHG